MIRLHRLGHQAEEFHLNPDLIVTVEANPDTVVTLTTGTKIIVAESPEKVTDEVKRYRVEILAGSIARRRTSDPQPHGISARRAAQGMLVALDRAQPSEQAADTPDSES